MLFKHANFAKNGNDVLTLLLDHPPTLIQHGGIEVMTADARAAHDMLAAAGADVTLQSWPGQGHVFQMFGGSASREALDELSAFIGPRT